MFIYRITSNGYARLYDTRLPNTDSLLTVLARCGGYDARVREVSRFIRVLSGATAPDEFPALALVLTVRGVVEVNVGAAAVPAQEALAHAVLTRADVVEERRRGIWTIAFQTSGYFKGVVIAAALIVVDREQGGVVVRAIRLLHQVDAVAAGSLADLKITIRIVGYLILDITPIFLS